MDELAYLKEMSILIGRSRETLRELRMGLSKHCASSLPNITVASEADDAQCPDMRYYIDGGVFGLIMGQIYDCRKGTTLRRQTMPITAQAFDSPVPSIVLRSPDFQSTTIPRLYWQHQSSCQTLRTRS